MMKTVNLPVMKYSSVSYTHLSQLADQAERRPLHMRSNKKAAQFLYKCSHLIDVLVECGKQ